MTVSTRYLPLASVAGMLLIAGCGGGSGSAPAPEPSPPPPPPVAFDLPDGELGLVPTGDAPLEIAAGAAVRRGNVEFRCAAGGEACVVKIMSAAGDDSTRTAAYEGTGGKVVARAAREDITAPGNHGLTDPVTVSAGAAATRGNVNIACPAGGMGCTVVVEGGAVKYLATGGAPVLTAARGDVTAPGNHGVTGTVKVSAGAAMRNGNVDIACPAGGADCTLVAENGAVKYLTAGGAPILTAALERMTVMDGHGLDTSDSSPIRVAAGGTLTRGNVVISCPAGGADCVVHVINAAGGGGVGYEKTGGAPTVAANGMTLALPDNHGLTAVGTRMIAAGGNPLRLGNVNISCPAGGRDCVVDVASDGGSATYRATGGAPTAAAAWDSLSAAPAGHGLASVEIAADTTHYGLRGVSLVCPTGAACSVAVGDDGAVTYKATGGTPTVMTDEMILAANSGPDRELSSDGGHAVGLVTRMGTQAGVQVERDDPADGNWPIRWIEGNNNSIQQGTLRPPVTTSAEWPVDADRPTLGVTLGREAFGAFVQTLPNPVPIDDRKSAVNEALPVEGMQPITGHRLEYRDAPPPYEDLGHPSPPWNGVVLKEDRGEDAGGTIMYAAVYSDIEKSTPSTPGPIILGPPDSVPLDLSPTSDELGRLGFPNNRVELNSDGKLTFRVNLVAGGNDETIITEVSLFDPRSEIFQEVESLRYRPEGSNEIDGFILDGNELTIKERWFLPATRTGSPDRVLLQCLDGTGTADACTVERDADTSGSITTITGVWSVAVRETGEDTPGKDDDHYLTLGVWMSLPEIADGRFDAGIFANGNVPVARDTLQALTGEARYIGPATGIYGRGVYGQAADPGQGRSGRPAVESAQVGSFRATAELTADFGAATELPRLRGFVNRFMENGSSLGDWTVQLDRTDGTDHRPDDAARYEMWSRASGEADGRRLEGEWAAEFFESTVGAADTNLHPGYVAGTFGVTTRDEDTPQDLNALHILGAFGAERQ